MKAKIRAVQAYQTISDIQANLTQKAYGYLELLDVLMDIQVVEHNGVSLLPLPTNNRFLQSLCTRLSKLLSAQSSQNEESDDSSDSDKTEEDGESDEQSDNDTDSKEIDKLRKEFKQSDKSVKEFIEELKEELQKNSELSEIPVEAEMDNDQLGGGSTNRTTANPYRSPILEALIQSYWTVSQVDAKRNYKKFLPKVWINPVTPYTFKTKELIDKPLVIFCTNGAGYNHSDMIGALKALPLTFVDTFQSDNNYFDGFGIFKGDRISLQEVRLPKKVLVFTNGCDSQHKMTITLKSLIEKGCEVEVFTMFGDHDNCGCPNFSHMVDEGIKLTRNLKVN
jgi:flagellar motility protein MotE (MotC chaperone)